jgi:O-acetyl-ADP-ribose deacetylase (regulator of RNase III)
MINYIKGDATNPVGDGVKVIVHVCNDIGAWGAGFVLALSRKWPEPEAEYLKWARETGKDMPLGEVQYVEVSSDIYVANMIGQHLTWPIYGVPPIRYGAIREGLEKISRFCIENQASVHAPKFGSGLAGGNWYEIEGIINDVLIKKGVEVTIYNFD